MVLEEVGMTKHVTAAIDEFIGKLPPKRNTATSAEKTIDADWLLVMCIDCRYPHVVHEFMRESALSVTCRVTARVTRWRDGDMRRRWCVSGLLQAESKFRRLKGHSGMPSLLEALERRVRGEPTGSEHEVA
jgi:hypothetical protein